MTCWENTFFGCSLDFFSTRIPKNSLFGHFLTFSLQYTGRSMPKYPNNWTICSTPLSSINTLSSFLISGALVTDYTSDESLVRSEANFFSFWHMMYFVALYTLEWLTLCFFVQTHTVQCIYSLTSGSFSLALSILFTSSPRHSNCGVSQTASHFSASHNCHLANAWQLGRMCARICLWTFPSCQC